MMATPLQKMMAMGQDIKLSHSVFAMPFAILAAFMAAEGAPSVTVLILVVVCMFFARTYAMLANRYFDRDIDAQNPRTAGRAIPAGRLSARDTLIGMIVCVLCFEAAAGAFWWLEGNFWPLLISPIAVIWLGTYGLFKRFTWMCHVYLGGALALSPIGAAVAVNPEALMGYSIWLLSAFVLFWVAGFDVIYALQDIESDQKEGIYSIPAKFGRPMAQRIAMGLHLLAIVALLLVGRTNPYLNEIFQWASVGVVVLIMIEHRLVLRGQFNMAFFTFNGFISLVIGALGVWDVMKGAVYIYS